MLRECYDAKTREWVGPDEYQQRKAARRVHNNENRSLPLPYMRGDLPEYISPITRTPVDGRVARREDLKRSECREVDPDEFKPVYTNRKWAKKRGFIKEE